MKPIVKKALTVCLTLVLSAGMFLSCSKEEGKPDTSDTISSTQAVTETDTSVQTETDVQTTGPAETIDNVMEPVTETEAVTEAPKPQEPAAAVVVDNGKDTLSISSPAKGTYINPLTGLSCTKERAERRPAAIMLNNISTALPQQQISYADILYECQVEGGLTRLLGIYNEWSDLKVIGSVRSSREYYIDFASNHDAIYVHAGGSESAYQNLKQRKTNNIDGVNDGVSSGYFYRDPVRLQTMRYEHTLVIDGDKLDAVIAKKKYRTTYSSSFANPMHFVGENQVLTLADGKKAENITVKFDAHTTSFTYDAEKNTYLRFQNGNKHIDGANNDVQLAFENIIVLICPYTFLKDDANHIEVADVGSGTGYYFTGGKYVSINWSKATADSQVKLTYAGGREVYLTPGKTNIEIINASKKVTVS
ncbi:MAG: DUF3048 domain-containing protein [Clostridia bacterium]|nr:DUF3048 domain-containing protein [Clostridia bacterium]